MRTGVAAGAIFAEAIFTCRLVVAGVGSVALRARMAQTLSRIDPRRTSRRILCVE